MEYGQKKREKVSLLPVSVSYVGGVLFIKSNQFVGGDLCFMLAVFGDGGIPSSILGLFVEMLNEVLNDARNDITGELCHGCVLLSVDKLSLSKFDGMVMLKVKHCGVLHRVAVIVAGRVCHGNGFGPSVRPSSKQSCGFVGVCHNGIGQRNEQGTIEPAEISHGYGVDVFAMPNVEMGATVGIYFKFTGCKIGFNADGLLANSIESFIDARLVFYITSTVISRKKTLVHQFSTDTEIGAGSLKFNAKGKTVGFGHAILIVVFGEIGFFTACVEFAHIAVAVASVFDADTNGSYGVTAGTHA